jgi:hypothetical protein
MSAPKDAAPLATPEAPWLGLRSFTEFAHGYFFGRGAELEDLFERIVDKPLTVLFGRSGLGKSSLLQASLTPRLRERGFLPVLVRFDHAPEAAGLGEQMLRKLLEALRSEGWGTLADRLAEGIREAEARPEWNAADFLWLIFHDPFYGLLPGRTEAAKPFPRPVFLIDQFEEIFTLGDRQVRRPVSIIFREALSSLVENRPPNSLRARLEKDDALVERIIYQAHPARFLLSLREDFLHVLERWRRSIPSLMENRFELRTLSGPQAFEAVVLPGQLRPGGPPIIPDEVGQAIVRFVAGVKGDVPLAEIDAVPPLLSLVCAELNAQRIAAGQPQITRAQFEGHSDEILLSFYNRSFEPASYGAAFEGLPGADATLRSLQRLIEDRLVSPDGFRENIAFDTIARDLARGTDPETAKVAMDKIVERRLLTVEERGGVRRLELAHDVLAPIVRASRDDRQEKEAVALARRDQERAEAETRKALHQRNRLRRWVGLSLVLAFLAIAAAVGAWLETKKAREAADSSIETLKAIYGDYVANSLENTPSVSAPQAKLLKSNLTKLLLSRSRDLYANQPGIRGTTDYMARLLVDQGRDATYDDHFAAADRALSEAMEWAKKQPVDSAASAELRADILLEEARVPFISGDQTKTVELANAGLSEVHAMESKWPDSWRLPYVEIRLENVLHANDKGPEARARFLELAARLDPLIKKSNNDFDPAFWRFAIESNSFRVAGTFTGSQADFVAVKDHIVWFREHLVLDRDEALATADQSGDSLEKIRSSFQDELSGSNDKSGGGIRRVIQIDTATENLKDFLSFLGDQFSAKNDPSTVEVRRSILGELERTMTLIESSLPPGNLSAYDAREKVLQLEESAKKDGASFLAVSELSAEEDKHASLRSSMVSTENVTEILVPAVKEYAADNGPDNRVGKGARRQPFGPARGSRYGHGGALRRPLQARGPRDQDRLPRFVLRHDDRHARGLVLQATLRQDHGALPGHVQGLAHRKIRLEGQVVPYPGAQDLCHGAPENRPVRGGPKASRRVSRALRQHPRGWPNGLVHEQRLSHPLLRSGGDHEGDGTSRRGAAAPQAGLDATGSLVWPGGRPRSGPRPALRRRPAGGCIVRGHGVLRDVRKRRLGGDEGRGHAALQHPVRFRRHEVRVQFLRHLGPQWPFGVSRSGPVAQGRAGRQRAQGGGRRLHRPLEDCRREEGQLSGALQLCAWDRQGRRHQ